MNSKINQKTNRATAILTGLMLILFMINSVGCKSSKGASAAAGASETPLSHTIVVSASPSSISAGQTMLLTPSGGTPPYSFILSPSSVGSLSTMSGSSTVYTSPAAGGGATVSISDSAGKNVFFAINAAAVGSALTLLPLNPSVAPGGTVNFSASGGVGSYTYTVLSPASGGGSFNSNVYTAPNTAQTVTIQVTDGAGHTGQTSVTVIGTAASATCAGVYNMNLDGTPATLSIGTNDANGSFFGSIQVGTGVAGISGSCLSGTINFVNSFSGSTYSGSYVTNSSNPAQITMTGIFVDRFQNAYPWFAVTR